MGDIEALKITVAQCNCLTKTPELKHHEVWCSYRVISACKGRITALETALRDCVTHMKTAGSPEAVRAAEAAERVLGDA